MSDIIDLYRDDLDLGNATFSRIDHHEAMIAVVYKVNIPNEKSLILKLSEKDEDFHRELFFLNSLAGYLPVPHVKKVAKPVAGRAGAILMECLEGALLKESDWTHELSFDIGSKLALLHSKDMSAYGNCIKEDDLTPDAQEYFADKFLEELNECENHLPEKVIKDCKHYFDSNKKLLNSVDGPCIVHRDFRPGNIIVHYGKLIGIIDWASGRYGFAEQDFCSMEHRNWLQNSDHKQSLLNGYSSIRPVPNYKKIMPLLCLGRALAVIGFTVKSGTWEGKDREIYRYNRQFIDGFFT